MRKLVRVGVMNNFNMTDGEYEELLQNKIPEFFVNSNVKSLRESIKPEYGKIPLIVTLNPDIDLPKFPEKEVLQQYNLRAFRVKVCGNRLKDYKRLYTLVKYSIDNNIKVLITFQRFYRLQTMKKFVSQEDFKYYEYRAGYLRPTSEYKNLIMKFVKKIEKKYNKNKFVFQCDKKDKGCPDCLNCAKLVYPDHKYREYVKEGISIYSLNLKSSGQCPFNCPDCFAKRVIQRVNNKISLGKIKMNNKQKGIIHGKETQE